MPYAARISREVLHPDHQVNDVLCASVFLARGPENYDVHVKCMCVNVFRGQPLKNFGQGSLAWLTTTPKTPKKRGCA